MEDHTKRARARSLLDMVISKGNSASEKMIGHLERIDPILCSDLGLSCNQSAQPATPPPGALSGSGTAACTVEEFWKAKQSDSSVYSVTKASYRSRVALLITNIEFSHEARRNGAEKDEEKMEKLLKNLGYEVVRHRNCTGQEINNALTDFTDHPKLKETDSVVVVIMSHGKLGAVLGVNWKDGDDDPDEFPINNIFTLLGPEKCPKLVNKPKVIIIQACRGGQKGSVLCSDAPNQADAVPPPEEGFEGDNLRFVHKEKDFIPLLSCTPDAVSYRHREQGSLLIQYMADIFEAHSDRDHIYELFRKVLQRFEDREVRNCLQMPTMDRLTLTKHFYLFPGLVDTNQ
ncbi:caspase a isoform X2 [Nothobranchius furzeri]|nr:caspase a isoform X2 [Nothobranchius furzeri]XP_054598448.1 caspase a isoform X2 [Nothobranchius furzeri]XP_054598449.1 caspase a isoform X2 [Nothobranchius furzeri]